MNGITNAEVEAVELNWMIGVVRYRIGSGAAFVTESPVPAGEFRFQLVRTNLRSNYFRFYEISESEKATELKRWPVKQDEPVRLDVSGQQRLALQIYRTSGTFDAPWFTEAGEASHTTRLVYKYGRKADQHRATVADVGLYRAVESPLTWRVADVGFVTSKAVPRYTELRIRVEEVGPGGEICIARSAEDGDVAHPEFLAVFDEDEVLVGASLRYRTRESTPLAVWFRPDESPDRPTRIVAVKDPEDPSRVSFYRLIWARGTVVAVQFKFGVWDDLE